MAISKRMNDKINEQIQKELYSEYYYLAMQAYFASMNLDGFANFFRAQALEERDHAIKFFNYVLETGGEVKLLKIQEPQADFKSPLDVFEKAYEHEQYVTKSIYELVDAALEERDHATNSFLQWYVTEQVEEESSMDNIVGKLKLIDGDAKALLLLDNELAQRTYVPMFPENGAGA